MAHGYAPPRDPTEVLGRRIAGYLIDAALLGVIAAILLSTAKHSTYFGAPSGACDGFNPTGTSSICFQSGSHLYLWSRSGLIRAQAFSAFFALLDLVVLQALTGASLGKLCVGLRVVDQDGRKANFLRMLGRWVFLVVDGGCFLVGLITTLATHPHRRVGDFVCGTYVVASSSVGTPVLGHRGLPSAYDPNAAWPAPLPIPPVPTPSPTSQWDSTAVPGPSPEPAPQWGRPPASAPGSSPPVATPPVAPLVTTSEAWAKPPIPSPAWPPTPAPPPSAGDETTVVPQPATFPPPPVLPVPVPAPPFVPAPEPEPFEDGPPPVTEPDAPTLPATDTEPGTPEPVAPARQAPTWSSVAPSAARRSPVAPVTTSAKPEAAAVVEVAPESKAEEWWDRALASDLSDEDDESDLE